MSATAGQNLEGETSSYRSAQSLKARFLRVLLPLATVVGIAVAVYSVFGLAFKGFVFFEFEYYYLIYALFGSWIFLIVPARKRKKDGTFQWHDVVLAALFFGLSTYFWLRAKEITIVGWVPPSMPNFILAFIYVVLILEAGRRAAGLVFFAVVVIIGSYPLYAAHAPGVFEGIGYPFVKTVGFYAFGSDGILGIPGSVLGRFLIGFLLFAGFLMASGAGKFFLDLATALVGRYRGGPAKVAAIASGFFGSLSGSVTSNVVATGSVTIPAMKRLGYPPHYAGAIEACASTGGMLMPPVMGTVAFVACMILDIPYATLIAAAAIPAILYYSGLLLQVDAYAARTGLKGLPKEELPSFKKTLKQGWHFIAVLIFLVWGLLYMRWEYMTPFYASALLVALSFASRETMLTHKKLVGALDMTGRLIIQVTALLLPTGIIIAALLTTGVAAAFTAGVVALGRGSLYLVLPIGIIACYVMGMAGMISPAYIMLAITFAPAVMSLGGLNELAVHLFIIYYSVLAMITLPVAVGAFVAATIAESPSMRTAATAMRLGIVLYFVPIFFVFNPALILEGPILETFYLFLQCLVGILFIAGGLEGYLLKVGRVDFWARPLLIVSGFLIAFPQWTTTFVGAALALLVVAIILIRRSMALEKLNGSE